MHAKQRLYLTANRDRLVGDGHPDAAFLYATPGDEIPASAADRFGLVDGELKPRAAKPDAPPAGDAGGPARAVKPKVTTKPKAVSENKETPPDADKGGGTQPPDLNAGPTA